MSQVLERYKIDHLLRGYHQANESAIDTTPAKMTRLTPLPVQPQSSNTLHPPPTSFPSPPNTLPALTLPLTVPHTRSLPPSSVLAVARLTRLGRRRVHRPPWSPQAPRQHSPHRPELSRYSRWRSIERHLQRQRRLPQNILLQ